MGNMVNIRLVGLELPAKFSGFFIMNSINNQLYKIFKIIIKNRYILTRTLCAHFEPSVGSECKCSNPVKKEEK